MVLGWNQLTETGDEFLESAPVRYVNYVEAPVSPEQTWEALTADDTLVSWTPIVTNLRWTTPRPFGVGTAREVTILRLVKARERYYRWDVGRRKSFSVVEMSIPGVRRLAEDYVVEPTPEGSRVIWILALEPHPMLTPLARLASPMVSWVLRGVARGMRRQLCT